ncbi:hypothetical protein BN873_210176 [Candidatus Competibacter denitrificans Run_A_D11]|uniref:Uncharacterized protein n=1 Tax=Candidatus Competibacter denitrificans Run_A_D11 TaxID=1400863 RepID=W6M898_9GAMM|nr:hypothetical protein BN873_210176 [Candidatus Competibacter denitrificans Run_A_D11]
MGIVAEGLNGEGVGQIKVREEGSYQCGDWIPSAGALQGRRLMRKSGR